MEISSIGYLQEKLMVDKENLPLTLTDANGITHKLGDLIDEIVDHRLKDVNLRNVAEISNMRKRQSKEIQTKSEQIKYNALESIIELDDDFHQSTKMLTEEQLELISPFCDKVKSILTKNGIVDVNPTEYDPDEQEVVSVVPSKTTEINVVSKGYSINGRMIRYPKVILFKEDVK
jgi:molecular chaperone GrpE (heat shock protein)